MLNALWPYGLPHFEPHLHSVLAFHAAGGTLPGWVTVLVAMLAVFGYYALLRLLLPKTRGLAALATGIMAASLSGLLLFFSPGLASLQFTALLLPALVLLGGWRWRVKLFQGGRASRGMLLLGHGLLGVALGASLPLASWGGLLWALGLGVLVARQDLKSPALRALRPAKLTGFWMGPGAFLLSAILTTALASWALHQTGLMEMLNSVQAWHRELWHLKLSLKELGYGLLLLFIPWGGAMLYGLWRTLFQAPTRSLSAFNTTESAQRTLRPLLLWSLVSLAMGLIWSALQHVEIHWALLALNATLAPVAALALNPDHQRKGLSPMHRATLETVPFTLLGLSLLSTWSILALLPNHYPMQAAWALPGIPVWEETYKLLGKVPLPFSVPLWKLWLLAMPIWCFIGGIGGLLLLKALKRPGWMVLAAGAWSLGYLAVLFAVQWPIAQPAAWRGHVASVQPPLLPARTVYYKVDETLPPYGLRRVGEARILRMGETQVHTAEACMKIVEAPQFYAHYTLNTEAPSYPREWLTLQRIDPLLDTRATGTLLSALPLFSRFSVQRWVLVPCVLHSEEKTNP